MTLSMLDSQVKLPETQTATIPTGSDTITCGQCSLKFYHVTQFLKHKSTCVENENNSTKDSEGKITGQRFLVNQQNKTTHFLPFSIVHFRQFLILRRKRGRNIYSFVYILLVVFVFDISLHFNPK